MTSPYAQPRNILVLLLLSMASVLHAQTSEEDLFFTPMLSVEVRPLYEPYRLSPDDVPEGSALLVVRQETHAQLDAILPVIFFDEASHLIPERYQTFRRPSDADDYDIGELFLQPTGFADEVALAKYHELLNIIGDRMRRDSGICVELEPTWSAEPGETAALARERAEVVAEYLENIWRIDSRRITILPSLQMAEPTDNFFAQQEARSVRIYPSSPSLFRPLPYRHVRLGDISYSIDVSLDPRFPRHEISRIMLVARMGDSILSENWLQIPDGEGKYSWKGGWNPRLKESQLAPSLTFYVLIQTVDGATRQSNSVHVPVVVTTDSRNNAGRNSRDSPGSPQRSAGGGATIPFFDIGSSDLNQIQRQLVNEVAGEWSDSISHFSGSEWYLLMEVLNVETGEMSNGGESACNYRMKEISDYFRYSIDPLRQSDPAVPIIFSYPWRSDRSEWDDVDDSVSAQRQKWDEIQSVVSRGYDLLYDFHDCRSEEEKKGRDSLYLLRADRLNEEFSEQWRVSNVNTEVYEVFMDPDLSRWLPEGRYYLRWVRVSLHPGTPAGREEG